MENIMLSGLTETDQVMVDCSYPDTICAGDVITANIDTGTAGNVGAGEDDLLSYTLPAGVMRNDGDVFHFKAFGTFGATANNKQLRVRFGTSLIYDSGVQAQNDGDWLIEGSIIRLTSSTQKFIVKFLTDTALFTDEAKYTTGSEDLTGMVSLKVTGEGVANDDIVQEGFIITYQNNG